MSGADRFERELAESLERQEFERKMREGVAPSVVDIHRVQMTDTLRDELCAGIIGALEGKARDKGEWGKRDPSEGQKAVGTAAQREAFARAVADDLPDLASHDWDGRRARDVADQCRETSECLWETLKTLYAASQGSLEFRALPEVAASLRGILPLSRQLLALERILITREYAGPARADRGMDKLPGIARATVIGMSYLQYLCTAPTTRPFERVCAAIVAVVPEFDLPRDAQRVAIRRLRPFSSLEYVVPARGPAKTRFGLKDDR